MSRTNPLSSAFWADADPTEPGSIASLESRRRIAEQLAGKKSPFPKTFGEGLTYLGESLAERARMNELADAERASDVYADKRANDIHNTPGGYVPPAEGTATAPAGRDAYAQTDSDLAEAVPPPRRPVGSEETGLPMATEPPPMPNALISALNTPPQRNQPGAPSTWGSGRLQQVPTNLANVPPGTFGMRDPATSATVSVGRGDEMTAEGQPAAAPMMPNIGLLPQPPGSLSLGVPFLTNEQRNRIAALISSQPRPFEQAPDAAPALETPKAVTAGQSGPLLADRETDADVRTPPIRMASLGGMPPPNTATAAANNPPIAIDIKSMPQVAENSPGIPPSRLPIPPDVPQEMKHPGPEPVQPRPLGPSQVQQKMESLFNDRRLDPTVREVAKQRYNAEEGYRKELEAARSNKYTNDRAQWNQDIRAYEKFVRETNDRDIERRIKLQGVEKTNADLEKMYFERGLPRQQAVEKARLDIEQAQRNVSKPDTFMAQGTQFQQNYDPTTGRLGPASVTPGAPAPEEKPLTAEQQQAVNFATTVKPDLEDVKTKLNHGKAMTSMTQNVLESGYVPGGHALTSQEYHDVTNKLGNFGAAFLKMRSGSAVTPSEAVRTLPSVMPRFGDTQADLEDKSRRRDLIVEGATAAAGSQARKVVDETLAEFNRSQGRSVPEASLPPARPKTMEEAQQLPAGRRFISPATGKEYTAHGQRP